MYRYILKRLLLMIPVIVGVAFIVYLILYLSPGDVTTTILGTNWTPETAATLREELGLNKPFLSQFLNYLYGLLRGDFGKSYITGTPVADQLKINFPNTFILVIVSMVMAIVISIPIGIRAAIKPNSLFSGLSTAFSLLGISAPGFWIGLLLVLLFSVRLHLLPSAGMESWKSVILPSFVLSLSYMAGLSRMMRSSMIEAMGMDYIRTAKTKGVRKQKILTRHALKNALLPTITLIGMYTGDMLGGAVICETVFAIPGMGRLMIESVMSRDIPCALAAVTVMAICVSIMSLLTDLAYAFFDPRIKGLYMQRKKAGE